MKNFFVGKFEPIKQGGLLHLSCILIVLIGLFLIIKNKDKIKNLNFKTKRIIKYFIIITMFLNMTIYYLSYIYYGVYNIKIHLPFHFCFISGYLYMASLLLNNEKLYKIAFYFAFMGPIPAIIWPDLKGGLNSFIFYQFFISHHFFLLSNLFMFYAYNYNFKKLDGLKAFVIANFIFIFMSIYNNIFGTNYIMSKSLPEYFLNMYPFFRNINYPIIILEIAAIIIILIANLFVKEKDVDTLNELILDK